MKNWKRVLSVFLILCIFAGILSGCGSKEQVTAESLMNACSKNLEKVDSMVGDMDMSLEMGVKQGSMSMNVEFVLDSSMEVTEEPAAFHMNASMKITGLFDTGEMEIYTVEGEDGKTTTYTKVSDTWTKSTEETDTVDSDQLKNLSKLSDIGKKYKLETKIEQVNGKDVYVLTASVDGKDLNKIMKSLSGVMENGMEGMDLDFSDATFQVTYKIYQDSKFPATINIAMDGAAIKMIEQDGTQVLLNNLTIDMDKLEYNGIKEIKIPEEAADAVENQNL